jgi:hypothetical protein
MNLLQTMKHLMFIWLLVFIVYPFRVKFKINCINDENKSEYSHKK